MVMRQYHVVVVAGLAQQQKIMAIPPYPPHYTTELLYDSLACLIGEPPVTCLPTLFWTGESMKNNHCETHYY